MTLAPSDICFIYNAKILNNEKYINKTLKEVFKASLNRIKIFYFCGYKYKICYEKSDVDDDRKIRRYIFEYEDTCTIKEMLEDFLRKTHSKMTLEPTDINFMHYARILNCERFFNKRLHEIFNFLMFFLFLNN